MVSISTMTSTCKISSTKVSQYLIIVLGLVIFAGNAFSETLPVLATADIYGAGHSTLPANVFPGSFPPSVNFVPNPNQILTFSSVVGTVGCNFVITNGPDGTCWPAVSTTVTTDRGVSGISVDKANMFLVGVFLGASEPSGAGPSVLKYNYGTLDSLNTADPSFSPVLDQVFFIGDGLTGTGTGQEQVFHVPVDASGLALGFADSFDSAPSFYGDDVGFLTATFAITAITTIPEPNLDFLVIAVLLFVVLFYRNRFQIKMN